MGWPVPDQLLYFLYQIIDAAIGLAQGARHRGTQRRVGAMIEFWHTEEPEAMAQIVAVIIYLAIVIFGSIAGWRTFLAPKCEKEVVRSEELYQECVKGLTLKAHMSTPTATEFCETFRP